MKRSGFSIMARLVDLVKPLTGYMILAITMGVIGHLCASFITVFGGYAVLHVLHPEWSMSLGVIFGTVFFFALVRGFLRYAEQACNHFIAFKLLALIRDKVFLVKPLTGYMILAITMGVIGPLCASFITVFGGYAVLHVLHPEWSMSLGVIFGTVLFFALVRGFLRYTEQACNHFIAFKLLALIRDKVFGALRRLCPAKLDGKDKGDLISVILGVIFGTVLFFALVRGFLRYTEQACNHFIAFKLLALIRDKVFGALRRLCPAKLDGKDKGDLISVITSDIELFNHFIAFKLLALIRDKVFGALRRLCPAKLDGKDKGDLISVITSDIELLEVFYAHTISPICIAVIYSIVMVSFIGGYHIAFGILAMLAYVTVGVVIPLFTSKRSGDDGLRFRTKAGRLSGFVLDSLRGLSETIQYNQGEKRLEEINDRTDVLSEDEERMKRIAGQNTAMINTVILIFDIAMLFLSAQLVGFEGSLIATLAMMSSFGPVVALAALGATLQNTLASGNRVLEEL